VVDGAEVPLLLDVKVGLGGTQVGQIEVEVELDVKLEFVVVVDDWVPLNRA
jgi:hypothetical protein